MGGAKSDSFRLYIFSRLQKVLENIVSEKKEKRGKKIF